MSRAERIRDELERILAHGLFSGADRRARLLRFLVEESLEGRAGELKESVIAVEVFDRPTDHDPRVDSLVRVEMGRLRSRLIEYYAQAGQNDPVRIEVPKGSYQPVFAMAAMEESAAEVVSTHSRRWFAGALLAMVAIGAAVLWRSRGATAEAAPPSLAVLPFLNLSGDPAKEYLGDSITDELTEALAESRGLRVVARTSAFQFKGKNQDVREIGRRLNATAMLEGSVQEHEGQVRVVVQLIRASDGYHIWSRTYDAATSDLRQVEAQIADSSRRALFVGEMKPQGGEFRTTANPEAHDLYLRAAYLFHEGNPDSLRQAQGLTQQALRLDPSFVNAHLLAGKIVWNLATLFQVSRQEARAQQEESMRAVLRLDPASSEAHTSLAMQAYVNEWDWPKAEREFQLALAGGGSNGSAHNMYGWSLMTRGRFEEARNHLRTAMEIDPLVQTGSRANLAIDWLLERKFPQARSVIDGMFAMNQKSQTAGALREWVDLAAGDCARLSELLKNRPDPFVDARCGNANRARQMLAEPAPKNAPVHLPLYNLAEVYGLLGDADHAIEMLERAAEQKEDNLLYVQLDPLLDSVRKDPRIGALVRRIGLMP